VTPTPREPLTRIEKFALLGGLALATALMLPLRRYLTDDTFIHLQYAKHLAEGQGLVFNAGERVYGCTSPLWAALIADGIALGLDGLVVARAIGFTATLLSVALFLQLLRRTVRTPELRAFAVIAWSAHAWMLRWSLSGMETPLAVALTLGGFVAYTEGLQWGSRPVRTGALWALAALTRPECVFLLALWFVFLLVDADSRNGVRRLAFGLVPPALIYGSWLLFAKLYFGTFWPQTLSAKAAGSGSLAFQLDNLWRQFRIVGATDGLFAIAIVLALGFGGPVRIPRGTPSQRFLPWAWVVGVPALYVARGVPVLSRYLLPLLPVLAWLAWRALDRWWMGENPAPARRGRAIGMGLALAAIVIAQNLTVYRTSVLPHVSSFTAGLQSSLIPWGKWFRRHAPPGASIAAPDIGAIGYFSGHRVIDLAGLVTPEMVPLLQREPQENAVANLSFAAFARPEFLIDRASVANDMLARSAYAAALTPIGSAQVPNLGIARPGRAVYTFYRVNWAAYDSLRAARAAPAPR
jgi:arabinofuranosyltransferase